MPTGGRWRGLGAKRRPEQTQWARVVGVHRPTSNRLRFLFLIRKSYDTIQRTPKDHKHFGCFVLEVPRGPTIYRPRTDGYNISMKFGIHRAYLVSVCVFPSAAGGKYISIESSEKLGWSLNAELQGGGVFTHPQRRALRAESD